MFYITRKKLSLLVCVFSSPISIKSVSPNECFAFLVSGSLSHLAIAGYVTERSDRSGPIYMFLESEDTIDKNLCQYR